MFQLHCMPVIAEFYTALTVHHGVSNIRFALVCKFLFMLHVARSVIAAYTARAHLI